MSQNVLGAFSLTLLAGLSTGVGSWLAFFAKRTNTRFLSSALGLSAGVMIYVSFMELLPQARDALVSVWGESGGVWAASFSFFGGILLIAVIDRIIPSYENPHEARRVEQMDLSDSVKQGRLMRMGILAAAAIAIHNFPEGLATFFTSLQDMSLGIPIAIAIAVHNIPEGIAVAVPIYYATGNRKKAFWYSFLSGLAEPLGALLGFLVLQTFLSPAIVGVLLGGVAGIMVFVSLDELFPAAREYGRGHLAVYGLITGMLIMAVSLNLLSV